MAPTDIQPLHMSQATTTQRNAPMSPFQAHYGGLLNAVPGNTDHHCSAAYTGDKNGFNILTLQVTYAEEAVQRGGLVVAACNGRDAIVLCLERPADSDERGPDPTSKGDGLQAKE